MCTALAATEAMAPVEHGRAYAKAIPGARLLLIAEAGHLPQLETPGRPLAAVWDFAETTAVG